MPDPDTDIRDQKSDKSTMVGHYHTGLNWRAPSAVTLSTVELYPDQTVCRTLLSAVVRVALLDYKDAKTKLRKAEKAKTEKDRRAIERLHALPSEDMPEVKNRKAIAYLNRRWWFKEDPEEWYRREGARLVKIRRKYLLRRYLEKEYLRMTPAQKHAERLLQDAESFILSDVFTALTGADGRKVLDRLDRMSQREVHAALSSKGKSNNKSYSDEKEENE